MKKRVQILAAILVMLWAVPVWAAAPTGELYGGLAYEWDRVEEKPVLASIPLGFRLALEDELDSLGKLHFSTKGWWDWKLKDGKLELDQLWLKGYYGDFDYQLGKQLISWGTADGFNPTNYFTRMSSSALLGGDLRGEAVWAGRVEYYARAWSGTAVVIPVFAPQKIDAFMEKLMLEAGPQGAQLLEAIEGAKKPGLGHPELALRLETQLAGFDLQASYFWGYEPLPGIELVLGPTVPGGMALEGTYRRQHFLGLALAGTLGPAGVWAEASYGGPEKFAEPENPYEVRIPMSINERYFQAVVGGDYTVDVGSGLLVQAQYIYRGQGSLLEPYVQPDLTAFPPAPGEIQGAHYLYGRLAYDFNPDASADLVILYGTQEKGGIIRPSYTHRLGEGLQLELSLVQPFGEGKFDSISTRAALTVKYQF
ncbi:MAG: hypothetical protein WBI99_09795 [Limnochordia bacterium]|nr:hypothetical protein [Limnochordia bacterium]MDI9466246.1 hypothetical protein [Bacillota bacterium]NLO95459.1 hypothetical protein [Bacillota bacterium]HAN95335.1 hypothetical protein [Bacillota bacterium]HOB40138.1 hypothetical protein [Limnochordia bacterium]